MRRGDSSFGTPWVLVNNAGIQDRQLLLEGTAEEWDRMNAVNARGPFLMIREIGRAMAAQGAGGRIINIATAGLRGSIVKGLAAYVGSKGALLALSRASAFELAEHKITVNTVLPGAVATPGARSAKGPAARRAGPASTAARNERASRHRRSRLLFRHARGPLYHQSSAGGRRRLLGHVTIVIWEIAQCQSVLTARRGVQRAVRKMMEESCITGATGKIASPSP